MYYKKKIDNPLHESFCDVPGSCSLEAIGFLFNLDVEGVLQVFKLTGWSKRRDWEGATTYQIRKAIRILSTLFQKNYKYHRLRKKIDTNEFIKLHRRGTFLLDLDYHLCVCKNGKLVDGWDPWYWDIEGYWEITDKYPKRRPVLDSYASAA